MEAILLVDEFPDVATVVVGEGFNVLMNVEIFPLIVLLVLYVPDPG